MPITRSDCETRDQQDALAPLRDQFFLPDGVIYLDGNSLGAQPRAALARAQQVITQEWGVGLIRSWNTAGWFELPQRLGDQLAPLVGAQAGELVVTDTTSINLFKVLAAALRQQQATAPAKRVIVSERRTFPTDLYIAQGLIDQLQAHGAPAYELRLIDAPDELSAALGDDVAVLMLTHVNYQTGYMFDMAAVTARAHQTGALTVWDLAHSAGAVPVALNASQADYAVGCTYKYLNGGPGSPAFLWVHAKHQNAFWQPLSGWWGHARPFAMEPGYRPRQGISRYLCGTQPITSLALVACGLDIFAQTSMAALRDKSVALTTLFIQLVQQACNDHPLTLITPTDPARRGSQVSYQHPQGFAVVQALIARGVIPDYREPRIMRFGFTPLYTRFVDVWDAVAVLQEILTSRSWDQSDFHQRAAVT
ncbi:kynureninase [Rhodoferax sp.]|uniref:kynureninase n=1 Tax=Rhodoferax sp. TaxID=50421 RepID=UPI0008BFE79A|nr:kynureninase [Rhodoferax sp.]MDO8319781.1 kynureninase [Rhodoferax sp.]OGB55020.1 MAG: kynureninase [Burkholderiales bacterium RIFOXYD12_FULL_59_19]OGB79840.1 MAG: kynureninase [Burkholderiales bacterium RIFOXYC12_FULL_60_6]